MAAEQSVFAEYGELIPIEWLGVCFEYSIRAVGGHTFEHHWDTKCFDVNIIYRFLDRGRAGL